jgi:hypothetical protein
VNGEGSSRPQGEVQKARCRVRRMAQGVVLVRKMALAAPEWDKLAFDFRARRKAQEGSVTASSTSRIGILSRTG